MCVYTFVILTTCTSSSVETGIIYSAGTTIPVGVSMIDNFGTELVELLLVGAVDVSLELDSSRRRSVSTSLYISIADMRTDKVPPLTSERVALKI